jgi:signal transduction histidine kinase
VKILIVDDSPTIQVKVKRALQRLEADVICAANGLEGLQILKSEADDIGVAILDEEMPHLKGTELCRIARTELNLKHLPLISLTSLTGQAQMKKIFEAGMSDYVSKPFSDEELIARVAVHYEKYLFVREMEQKIDLRTKELSDALVAAEAAAAAKGRFVANISHEMRTPLNGIIGFSNLIAEKFSDSETSEQISLIRASAGGLLQLINNILDYSKLDAAHLSLENRAFNLPQLLNEVERMFSIQAHQTDVNVSVIIDDKLPKMVIGDQFRLQQVFLNLLSNAVKFTLSGGHVILHTTTSSPTPSSAQIIFAVTDCGIGMNEDEISRIFKPFQQADVSTTRKYGGTGLGLAISNQLVNLMGGKIEVKSEKGIGSCFAVDLTFQLGEVCETKNSSSNDAARVLIRPCSILVVEDNVVNQKLITTLLKKDGHTVHLSQHGQEAVDAFNNHTFDIILMDCQMPVMDGYQASTVIREHEANANLKRIPIVAVSANAMKGDREKCLEAGMDELIPKPIDRFQLQKIIYEFTDR